MELRSALAIIEGYLNEGNYFAMYFSDEYQRYYAEIDDCDFQPATQIKASGKKLTVAIVRLADKLLAAEAARAR